MVCGVTDSEMTEVIYLAHMKNENKSGGRKREGKAAVRGPKALTPGSPGRPWVGLGGGQTPLPASRGPFSVARQEQVASPFPPLHPAGGGRCFGSSQARLGGQSSQDVHPSPPELPPPEDGADGAVRVTARGSVLEDVFRQTPRRPGRHLWVRPQGDAWRDVCPLGGFL